MDGEHPIFKATRRLCDEVNQTLKIVTNDTKHDISNSRHEYRKKHMRRRHRIKSDEISQMFTGNNHESTFSLDIAKSIITSTTDLTVTARNINSKCNDFRLKSLIQVVTKQHIEAAIRLVQRYKIFSVNAHCLLCQEQFRISLGDIDRTLERMISVCSKLYPSRRQLEELIVPATATREALNTLRTVSISKSINKNETPVLIEEPTDLTQSAKILGEATAQVLLAIKEIVQEKPKWKGKKFLIDAAIVLSDTTTRLVKYAQFSIWYSELKHILSSLEIFEMRLRNEISHDFLQILQFAAREVTNFSITSFNLAKKINVNTKTLVTFSFLNETLSLIYLAENFIKITKKANSSPLTPKIYREILEHNAEFIQEAKWVLDSFRNAISSLTTRS